MTTRTIIGIVGEFCCFAYFVLAFAHLSCWHKRMADWAKANGK